MAKTSSAISKSSSTIATSVLQLGAGDFGESAIGEHLFLQSTEGQLRSGQRHLESPHRGSGRIPDLGNKAMSLLVDSGANYLTLFDDHAAEVTSTPGVSVKAGAMDSWTKPEARTRMVRSLYLRTKLRFGTHHRRDVPRSACRYGRPHADSALPLHPDQSPGRVCGPQPIFP